MPEKIKYYYRDGIKQADIVHEWPDLRQTFIRWIKRDIEPSDRMMKYEVNKWHDSYEESWVGTTGPKMVKMLENGYHPPELAHIGDYTPTVKRRRYRWAEEGELDFVQAWCGDPFPFREWDMRERKPGLRIVVDMALHCGTPASVLAEYGAWIAGIMAGMETAGYDLEVDIGIVIDCLFTSDSGSKGSGPRTNTLIRVKRENEAADFTEWSPLFAPGGFRTLGFAALGLSAEKTGKQCASGLGYPIGRKWDIEFEAQTRTLRVISPDGSQHFPATELSSKIMDTGLLAKWV